MTKQINYYNIYIKQFYLNLKLKLNSILNSIKLYLGLYMIEI